MGADEKKKNQQSDLGHKNEKLYHSPGKYQRGNDVVLERLATSVEARAKAFPSQNCGYATNLKFASDWPEERRERQQRKNRLCRPGDSSRVKLVEGGYPDGPSCKVVQHPMDADQQWSQLN